MTEQRHARSAHPLLGVFPLAVMTLATFLVLFAFMMARLTAGGNSALRASSTGAVVETLAASRPVSTRASGAGAGAPRATSHAAFASSSPTTPVLSTRSSGSTGGIARDD